MSNFFLLNEAISTNDYNTFLEGVKELFLIDKREEDLFLKHESFWNIDLLNQLYMNYSNQDENAICIFIEQLKPSEEYFNNSNEIDNVFIEDENGFLGIDFINTEIESERQIINNASYTIFNQINWENIDFRNLWKNKTKLFPSLILCGEVKNQIEQIGASGYFNQIVDKLKIFNEAVDNWKEGSFNYNDINANYALRISPESASTMNRYGNERRFSLPNGGTELFELHIKTGDLRFHFFPDNITKKVYVGYIGVHLSIVTN